MRKTHSGTVGYMVTVMLREGRVIPIISLYHPSHTLEAPMSITRAIEVANMIGRNPFIDTEDFT